MGHTRLLLDGNGNVKNRYAYDAWGNLIEYEENVPNPFTWNGAYGYEWIPLTGLYHVGAREYDPRTGRWLQRDPIEASSGDPHFWRYCGNDPLNGVDPSGLDAGWAMRPVPNDPYGEYSSQFSSADEAATEALRQIFERTKEEEIEYGGFVIQNRNGSYSYTYATQGNAIAVRLRKEDYLHMGYPANSNFVANYHTHPDHSWSRNIDEETFSLPDLIFCRKNNQTGYLGTPQGYIKRVRPGTPAQEIGRIDQ